MESIFEGVVQADGVTGSVLWTFALLNESMYQVQKKRTVSLDLVVINFVVGSSDKQPNRKLQKISNSDR